MHDEPPPRKLKERTGKHYCIRCLSEVQGEEYLANDHLCQRCAEEEGKEDEGGRKDEG